MISILSSIENSIVLFFEKLTELLGFGGYLAVVLGVEALFVLLYGIKSAYSYEARFKRAMNKANSWLFTHKKLTTENIRQFTNILKKAPKRVTYFWQQFIMYREGGPIAYLTEENLIEKPLRTSSWLNNVKNLSIATSIWTVASAILGVASLANKALNFSNIMVALILPLSALLVGGLSIIMIKGFRYYNLEDVYESYHIFSRFLTNACDTLPPYIELDMLFTKKELSRASVQLREFYESNARKAKQAFEEAKKNEERVSEFNFADVGVDGALLLDRAMKESENYINQKTKLQSKIAQVEAQKDAMRRNYENIQMDLQRKIQASKENIQKLIEQQAATTSRIEVGLLRQQQDKEAKKLEDLQRDYDKEETRYKSDRDEHEKEIESLKEVMRESLTVAEKGMASEYQTFLEKVMKSAYEAAQKKVERERSDLEKQSNRNESELISVQTQIKRMMDENVTLRSKLEEYNPDFKSQTSTPEGHYDENGNYVYADGSYHDEQGLFHDVDGNVYNMNGEIVSKDYTEEEAKKKEQEDFINGQINQFGGFIDENGNPVGVAQTTEEPVANPEQSFISQPIEEEFFFDETSETAPVQSEKQATVEDFSWDEDETTNSQAQIQNTIQTQPVVEDFGYDEPSVYSETQADEPVKKIDYDEPVARQVAPASALSARRPGRPRKEETVVQNEPAKKRGRPRKVEVAPAEPVARRGRPRKDAVSAKPETQYVTSSRPKPRKRVVKEEIPVMVGATKKRGRPRKEVAAVQNEPAKKRGRPRKTDVASQEMNSISKISQLINEEEAKLNKMKAQLNNEISQAMVEERDVDAERAALVAEFERLKVQAEATRDSASSDELASINTRLQQLIRDINVLNNRK